MKVQVTPDLFIGILSGTSLDAIDIALIDFSNDDTNDFISASIFKLNSCIKVIAKRNYPIEEDFKLKCRKIIDSDVCNLDDFGQLDHFCGLLFANAINTFLEEHNINSKDVKAIGSHGQTIRHKPNLKYPFSLQIGDPNIIAYKTKIPVIADFRRKDIAAGGQGAPLAPFFHNNVFRSENRDRVIVNIGGISNITILPKDKNKQVKGYDTGPGNCLIDFFVRKYFNEAYDKDGKYARNGIVDKTLLSQMLKDSFFSIKPPRSTGTDFFNSGWIKKYIPGFIDPEYSLRKFQNNKKNTYQDQNEKQEEKNIIATLTHLTAHSIVNEIKKEKLLSPEIYICGGGAHNKYLLEVIEQISGYKTSTTKEIGIEPDWVEACLFAWLAKSNFYNEIKNFSETIYITGAQNPICLGGLY